MVRGLEHMSSLSGETETVGVSLEKVEENRVEKREPDSCQRCTMRGRGAMDTS